jgi:LacI family transcriptional regulator
MEDCPAERVPLRAIAEKAKVSRMTVSRALRDDASIPPTTCRRIRKIAKQLGYRPDPNLTQLMEAIRIKKRDRLSNVIAYLTAHDDPAAWRRHPVQRRYFEAAVRRATECGYRLEEFWGKAPGMNDERLSEIIHHRGIDGIIVAPLPVPQLRFQNLRWGDFSAVEIGYSLPSPELHRVCNHQFQSMMLQAQRLYAMGYRRVGLAMNSQQDERVNHHWRAGHLAAHSLWGQGDLRELMFLPAHWDRTAFARWYGQRRPDAIITIGAETEEWIKALGLRVPQEVGIANVDLRPEMKATTGIDQNSHEVGTAAVDLVISLMCYNERGVPAIPSVTMVQGTFVEGKTTRPMAGSAKIPAVARSFSRRL